MSSGNDIIIVWRRWPVVSERFGCLLGTVEVPGEPEKWQPWHRMMVTTPDSRLGVMLRLRWDAVGRRYIAPEGFPLGRLTTFQHL